MKGRATAVATPTGIVKQFESVLQSLTFFPEMSAEVLQSDHVLSHTYGYFALDANRYLKLIERFGERFPNIADRTVDRECKRLIRGLLDEMLDRQEVNWTKPCKIADTACKITTEVHLQEVVGSLISGLDSLVRDYRVFVPLMGVELDFPEYDFGSVKLVRTTDSRPIRERAEGIGEFKYVHQDILEHFSTAPCIVESHIIGDDEFVRREGLRHARQLAAILNLHLSARMLLLEMRQRIQCVGLPASHVRVILTRIDWPDEVGNEQPTYLHATSKHRFATHKLNATDLAAIKGSGFDKIWECFAKPDNPSDQYSRRIQRAVSWFDKAVNFDETDAQFVGLATALEILLVRTADADNPFSSWLGITQQLGERCAFLLGSDLRSTLEFSAQIKLL